MPSRRRAGPPAARRCRPRCSHTPRSSDTCRYRWGGRTRSRRSADRSRPGCRSRRCRRTGSPGRGTRHCDTRSPPRRGSAGQSSHRRSGAAARRPAARRGCPARALAPALGTESLRPRPRLPVRFRTAPALRRTGAARATVRQRSSPRILPLCAPQRRNHSGNSSRKRSPPYRDQSRSRRRIVGPAFCSS